MRTFHHLATEIDAGLRVCSSGAVLLAVTLAAGCSHDSGGASDMSPPIDLTFLGDSSMAPYPLYLSQPDVTPRTIFESLAKQQLGPSCQPCHGVAQGSIPPFLTPGMEYQSITGYKLGTFLAVPIATQSLLLQKGAHTGPALTPGQYSIVLSWLEAELATRPSTFAGMMKTALLPTVPVAPSDYNMNFGTEVPISDSGANITFTLTQTAGQTYQASKLTLTAGLTTGIHIGHPRLFFFTTMATSADPADSLATVDQVVPAGASITIGSGSVLLANSPTNDANTRIGLAFQSLTQVNPTGVMALCKAFPVFNTGVINELKICAGMCHRPGQNNASANAWDLSSAMSTDQATLQQLCAGALGRINPPTPTQSILLTQALPPAMGGTQGHPYKVPAADISRFSNAILTWVASEK